MKKSERTKVETDLACVGNKDQSVCGVSQRGQNRDSPEAYPKIQVYTFVGSPSGL